MGLKTALNSDSLDVCENMILVGNGEKSLEIDN